MPQLSEAELAARYGWSMALLNSDPSLKNLFNRAVAETWTTDRFTAELRATTWYQQNADTVRQAAVLRSTDPATWKSRVANQAQVVMQFATQMGARITPAVAEKIADSYITLGWADANLRSALSQYITHGGGQFHGQAQQVENELWEYARQMGVRVDQKTVKDWAVRVAGGKGSVDTYKGSIQNMAESAFPHLKERFNAGETFEQIASPYKQSMANLLEMSSSSIDAWNPTIRSALAAKTQDGKPELKTLWQFENDLRNDSRWLKTKNAQDSAMETTRRVLGDMGLVA